MLPSPPPTEGSVYPPSSEPYTSHGYVPNTVLIILLIMYVFQILECSSLTASEYNGNLAARLANCTARTKLMPLKTFSAGLARWK
ncbi:hypothetical protein OIU85_001752 [Salix viminalis]|uniref:Uncharacterized protein n=1 Tax=Salix viminalis TaxID=40686 RepID=A0A9Q0ZYF0_SALVM|nr:hypothetical protein OIU85_001752 [Salix viminalis]